jgi:hypothetical protein
VWFWLEILLCAIDAPLAALVTNRYKNLIVKNLANSLEFTNQNQTKGAEVRIKSKGKKYDVVCYAPIKSLTPNTLAVLPDVGVIPVSEFARYEFRDTEQVLAVKPVRWRANLSSMYYFVGANGKVYCAIENDNETDDGRHSFGNYFKTRWQAFDTENKVLSIFPKSIAASSSNNVPDGGLYFFIGESGLVCSVNNFGGCFVNCLRDRGNFFLTEGEASVYADMYREFLLNSK